MASSPRSRPSSSALLAPLPKSADAARAIRWLTRIVSLTAADQIARARCGLISEAAARAEVDAAAREIAAAEGWIEAIAEAAAEGAWRWGSERFDLFRGKLRGRLWPMGKVREPGVAIMAEAARVNDEFGGLLPSVVLQEAAGRIARAAAAPRRIRLSPKAMQR